MGQELAVEAARTLAEALDTLAAAGVTCHVLMVDGQLVAPAAPAPAAWREIRLRTPAGMVTLRGRGDQVALVVFGNADGALLEARARVAAALTG
jgi:hypothetical protein